MRKGLITIAAVFLSAVLSAQRPNFESDQYSGLGEKKVFATKQFDRVGWECLAIFMTDEGKATIYYADEKRPGVVVKAEIVRRVIEDNSAYFFITLPPDQKNIFRIEYRRKEEDVIMQKVEGNLSKPYYAKFTNEVWLQ